MDKGIVQVPFEKNAQRYVKKQNLKDKLVGKEGSKETLKAGSGYMGSLLILHRCIQFLINQRLLATLMERVPSISLPRAYADYISLVAP